MEQRRCLSPVGRHRARTLAGDAVGITRVATKVQAEVFDFPIAASSGRAAYVAGTFDTKGRELFYLRQCLEKLGLRVVTVDLATSGRPSPASVHPREVARHDPDGERAVFTDDRGSRSARWRRFGRRPNRAQVLPLRL